MYQHIGTGDDAETILYKGKDGNNLTVVTRGFQGDAKAWDEGTYVARLFTDYDYDTLRTNLGSHITSDARHAPISGTTGHFLRKTETQTEWVEGPLGYTGNRGYTGSEGGLSSHDNTYHSTNYLPEYQGEIKSYSETVKNHGNASGTITLNYNDGNIHILSQTGNITLAFSNWPSSGKGGSITLIIEHDSTERTWVWAESIVWSNKIPPDMSETDITTILTFTTIDGGTTVYGFVAGQDFSSGS